MKATIIPSALNNNASLFPLSVDIAEIKKRPINEKLGTPSKTTRTDVTIVASNQSTASRVNYLIIPDNNNDLRCSDRHTAAQAARRVPTFRFTSR